MQVIEDCDSFEADGGYAAVIGFFDGVHEGHKSLLDSLKSAAAARGLKTVVVTFAIHPREILKASYVPKLLTTKDERIKRLEKEGVDLCYVIKSKDTFDMTSGYFMHHVLAEKLNVKYLLVGYDHHFGKDRENGFDYYKSCGDKYGVEVEACGVYAMNKKQVSSSMIRKELEAGKVDVASRYLGYNYSIEGTIVHGRNIGKTIGFPTANVALSDVRKLIPMEGVYSVKVTIEGDRKCYKGVLNIGVRPTFIALGASKTIEVHILDFEKDIYQKKIHIEMVKYLRAEEKFENPQLLARQIKADTLAVESVNR